LRIRGEQVIRAGHGPRGAPGASGPAAIKPGRSHQSALPEEVADE